MATSGPRPSRSILVLGIGAAVFLSSAGLGLADPGSCDTLARNPGQSPVHWRKLDRAIGKQQEQLGLALQREERMGCSWGQPERQDCRSLARSVERMERNLGSLERQLAALKPLSAKNDALEGTVALGSQDCAGPELDPGVTLAEPDGFFAEDGPLGEASADTGTSGQSQIYRILGPHENLPGTVPYRTICVRTCDGYFFPMSPASSPVDFDRDQDRCEAACPGTDVRLYVQEGDGQEAEAMISAATGESYRSFPNAFLYRQTEWKQPASCGCGAEKGFSILSGAASPPAPVAPQASTPKQEAGAEEPTNRKVRVVLPGFLPDPSAAAVPRAPDPSEGR